MTATTARSALQDTLRDRQVRSLLVVQHGEPIFTHGPQDVPLPVHSIRKSLLSALFGNLIQDGRVALTTNARRPCHRRLAGADVHGVFGHLLTSSSGVYLPLAYDTSFDVFDNAPAAWPERGSSGAALGLVNTDSPSFGGAGKHAETRQPEVRSDV